MKNRASTSPNHDANGATRDDVVQNLIPDPSVEHNALYSNTSRSNYIMKFLTILAISFGFLTASQAMDKPSFHTKGTPSGKPTGTLKPGEYWWNPQLSPSGPVVVLVSIPQQTMHVYRNGILIGRSTVSTGTKGHSTPGGVFSILEKQQSHRSKTYNNAPMPYMQRLTWSGIAMHSGQLPGYPASHGCIRLPYDFSQLLFKATAKGGTVVVGDGKTPTPHLASNPGLLLAPKDFTPDMVHRLAKDEYDWRPERSTQGPITIVVSSADKALYVYRNGNPIGRAAVQVSGQGGLGNSVFTLLEGHTGKPSQLAPGHEAGNWMRVTSQGRPIEADEIASRIRFNTEFAQKLADEIKPGTTVIVTDHPVVRNPVADSTVFAAN
ncbi:MAG: L,D-transpeptidase [Alphaproteobacteria bacterium]